MPDNWGLIFKSAIILGWRLFCNSTGFALYSFNTEHLHIPVSSATYSTASAHLTRWVAGNTCANTSQLQADNTVCTAAVLDDPMCQQAHASNSSDSCLYPKQDWAR